MSLYAIGSIFLLFDIVYLLVVQLANIIAINLNFPGLKSRNEGNTRLNTLKESQHKHHFLCVSVCVCSWFG